MNLTRSHFTAADNRKAGYTHVLLITTGSVASIKAPLIVAELLKVRICTATKYIRTEVFFLKSTTVSCASRGHRDEGVIRVL